MYDVLFRTEIEICIVTFDYTQIVLYHRRHI